MNKVQILVHPCPVPVRSRHEECWLTRKLVDSGVGGINEKGKEKKGREREEKGKEGRKKRRIKKKKREAWERTESEGSKTHY